VISGDVATAVSAIIVKPDGCRTVVNFRKDTPDLNPDRIDLARLKPGVILFDGHQPDASVVLAEKARDLGIATVLDAGSVHKGTRSLVGRVDALVASRRFAVDFTGTTDEKRLAEALSHQAPVVVVTLGARGLVWHRGAAGGSLPAYAVDTVDSTGAGDGFHGAFAAGWSMGMDWPELLRFAAATGALCCTAMGARPGMPSRQAVDDLMAAASPAIE
jgi:sulfofructose kinase